MNNTFELSINKTLNLTTATTTTIATETTSGNTRRSQSSWPFVIYVQIACYIIIFILSVIGNIAVIATITIERRNFKQTINSFMLNLAVSDLLLGVFCMPFTLIGFLLRDFVFGELLCKIIPYFQATSVAVSAWTLVFISMERYYAICFPLQAKNRQNFCGAPKIIFFIWFTSLVFLSPIALTSKLVPTQIGTKKCREKWSSNTIEAFFNVFLSVLLLIVPLVILSYAYFSIIKTLRKSIEADCKAVANQSSSSSSIQTLDDRKSMKLKTFQKYKILETNKPHCSKTLTKSKPNSKQSAKSESRQQPSRSKQLQIKLRLRSQTKSLEDTDEENNLWHTNLETTLKNKKHVIKMLCVVVMEFFVCWTPLYVINLIALYSPKFVYDHFGHVTISFMQLLAYFSSCCNPITYCFMMKAFRESFLNLFSIRSKRSNYQPQTRSSATNKTLSTRTNRNNIVNQI